MKNYPTTFKAIAHAIEGENKTPDRADRRWQKVIQETRRWDDNKERIQGYTFQGEDAQDYTVALDRT